MGRRLTGAIVDGIGLSIGRKLFDEALGAIEEAVKPEDPAAAEARVKAERKAHALAEKERRAADKAREKADAKAARAVEKELAALKRKVAKER